MSPSNFAENYHNSMAKHPFGYAFYEPPAFSKLRPGVVGYVDALGRWHHIVDLTNASALKEGGFKAFRPPVPDDPDPQTWGAITSGTVTDKHIKLEGDIDAASMGFPADIGGVVEYSSKEDFGAVLTCDDQVISEGYDVREPFRQWLKDNTKTLLKNHRDVEKQGVCVAIRTYSSRNIHIAAWDDPEKTFRIGVKVKAAGIGGVGPEVSWTRSAYGSGWRRLEGDKRVIFFSGVRFKYWLLGAKEDREDPAFRGGEDANEFDIAGLEKDQSCKVLVEEFGMLPDEMKCDG